MATKSKAAAKSTTRKRYTDAEKADVLNFVDQVNSERGRGGQSAASKKFGISQLTIMAWRKAGGAVSPSKGKATRSGIDSKLSALTKLHGEIAAAEKSLQKLRSKFDALKKGL